MTGLKDISLRLYEEFSKHGNVEVDKDSIDIENNRDYYWWTCEYGHNWRARLDKRLKGSGCVYCMHKKLKGR